MDRLRGENGMEFERCKMLTESQSLDCAGVSQSQDCVSTRPARTFSRQGSKRSILKSDRVAELRPVGAIGGESVPFPPDKFGG